MGPVRRLLVLLVLGAVALLGVAPALAHGEDGTLEVIDAVPTAAGNEVTYTLELTYANDGDPVDGAVVSATVRQPGAGPQDPIALASIGEGGYAGPVTFPGPGRWTVAFAAIEPAAEIEVTYQVPAGPSPATTAAPTTRPHHDHRPGCRAHAGQHRRRHRRRPAGRPDRRGRARRCRPRRRRHHPDPAPPPAGLIAVMFTQDAVPGLAADQPGVVSTALAESLGRERLALKSDIRKLKALGLTLSLEVGYELSPRGRAFLDAAG